ncbi:MAG: type II secretion system ATPase GspE [Halothiobacillaceae bacterium]
MTETVPEVHVEDLPESPDPSRLPVTRRVSYGYAKRHGVLARPDGAGGVDLLHCRPLRPEVISELQRALGEPFRPCLVTAGEFEPLLAAAYETGSGAAQEMVTDLGGEGLDALADQLNEPVDLLESEDEAPIIRVINALLTEAVREGASDIHVESFESRMVVRFRVDGVLREVLEPPRQIAPLLVSRIKVMARLDIAEKRLPQDGRISLALAGRPVDVRVSTLPSGQGERVVMRLLDKQAGRLNLAALGMGEEVRQQLIELIHRPHGILLVTGPTGSGKTTTLYAALTQINSRERNILTVEDPIEYYLDGIGQTQVNNKVDMTFARGLRAILRQDPDVVMVGEIRDLETAQIAVQASLTGHLVLSTLHTNSAIGAITRLRDMGVEPFLLSSSLIGVLAQRLVRRLDPETREAYTPDAAECRLLGVDPADPPTLYRPSEASLREGGGYKGRMGIYELIRVDGALQRMIHDGDGEQAMEQYLRQKTPSLRAYGLACIRAGLTTTEEVLRVTSDNA